MKMATVRRYMQEILKYFKIATRTEPLFAARQQAFGVNLWFV
jgi:hypothetical protein